MLIILGGLPGTGKTTIAKELAKHLKAVYLRIDTVEQTLKAAGHYHNGPEGYLIGYALAKENLSLGLSVVADSVNSIALTRQDWQETATSCNTPFIEVEIICFDPEEHRRRIETRVADIDGHELPTWHKVKARDYEPWPSALKIDTAVCSVAEAVTTILGFLNEKS